MRMTSLSLYYVGDPFHLGNGVRPFVLINPFTVLKDFSAVRSPSTPFSEFHFYELIKSLTMIS